MSNHDEQDLLVQALRDRAAGVSGTPLDLDTVRGRARGIRRRRNALRATVAAMVATVAVPSGLAVTTALDSPDGATPPPVASGTPDTSATGGTAPAGPTELTLDGLPQGAPPRAPYLLVEERRWVTPEGPVQLEERYSMLVAYDGGWLAAGTEQRPDEVVLLDEELAVQRRFPGSATVAVTSDGSHVAFAETQRNGDAMLFAAPADGGDPLSWTIPLTTENGPLEPVGFLDDQTVVYQTAGAPSLRGVASVGGETRPLKGFVSLADASDSNGLVAGAVSYDATDTGNCSGVLDVQAGEMLWEHCDLTLFSFSPDGRYLTAGPGYFDAVGPSALYVLDAETGEVVADFSPEPGGRTVVGVAQAGWEDEDTVLAVVQEGDDQALVRAELDGSLEKVTATYRSQDMSMRLWLTGEPR